jgi:hypothetical protein
MMQLLEADLLTPSLVLPAAAEAAPAEIDLRIASYAWASDRLDTPASTVWYPRIVGGVTVEQDGLTALGSGGVVALTVAELAIADQDGWADDMARYNTADGREIELRVAEVVNRRASDVGTPLRSTSRVWLGRTRRLGRIGGRRATLAMDDLTARLTATLQPSRYTGAGGLFGPAGLADRPKPMLLGRRFNVPAVDLGQVDLGDGARPTFQTHWRAVIAHDAVRVRGVDQVAVMTAPGVGEFRDWPGLGLFQLGTTPNGPVTAQVRGEADGFPVTTAAILWRLLTVTGPQLAPTERDSDSWAYAEAALGGDVGFWQGAEDITALAAAERLLAGCGAVLAGDRDGKLRLFDPFQPADFIQFDLLPVDLIADPEPTPLPAALSPAPREVRIDWGQNDAPLAEVGLAANAAIRGRLGDAVSPQGLAASALITARVAQQRVLTLSGLYADEGGAQGRAQKMIAAMEQGLRAWTVTTDRYLAQINLGDTGRVTYPIAGLSSGVVGVVVGLREDIDRRRVTLKLLASGG